MMRGKAVALSTLIVSMSLAYASFSGISAADEERAPIMISGDAALASCTCVRSGTGTLADPFVISDWRIVHNTGTAIEVRSISTYYFALRDNTLLGKVGVKLVSTGNRGTIESNEITSGQVGIELFNSSPLITGNIVQGPSFPLGPYGSDGIRIEGGSPTILSNLVTRHFHGITARSASPTIEDNEIVANFDGVFLTDSTSAVLEDNVVRLTNHWGLIIERSASATLINNEIREGKGGVVVTSATLYMEGNRVINQRAEAVSFTSAHVTMLRNNITDNWRGAEGSTDSDVMLVENVFTNNQDAGIRLTRSEGTVQGNLLELNGVGIAIEDSIVTLTDNVMNNNQFGLSIPYISRQTIPLMSGNVVNGVNVDGTIVPSEKALYYMAAGVTVAGQLVDSGHSSGFFGTVTQQGALVFYDSIDVLIENNTFAFNHRAIFVVNSTFVTIRNNTFTNNQQGVFAEWSRTFIKDNECDIDIDPALTFCFFVSGGFATIRSNFIANVDIGIRLKAVVDMQSQAIIEDNVITGTAIGVKLEGTIKQKANDVVVRFNRVEANARGMVLIGFHGTLLGNLVGNNSAVGLELRARTNATFTENRVLFNVRGILDADACTDEDRNRCSSGVFLRNRVKGSAEVGIELHNGGVFESDVVSRNRIGLIVEGKAAFHDVRVHANKKVGLQAAGVIGVRGGNFTANGEDGIRATGRFHSVATVVAFNKGDGADVTGRAHIVGMIASNNSRAGAFVKGQLDLRHGNFSGNLVAGLRLNGTLFELSECEVSFNANGILMAEVMAELDLNPELPPLPTPSINFPEEQDPLIIEDCNIVKNAHFALQASVNTVVDADLNFWGTVGPKIDIVAIRGTNVIQAIGIFTPYWKDRLHTEIGILPTTVVGPTPPI